MNSTAPHAPVWISGYGAVSCVAADAQGTWRAAREGRSGIRDGLGEAVPIAETERTLRRLAKVDGTAFSSLRHGKGLGLVIASMEAAIEAAGWDTLGPEDGLILATTTGQGRLWEDELVRYLMGQLPEERRAQALATQPLGVTLAALRECYGFFGRATVLSSACSASTHAIALGARWVRSRQVRRCLVGGVEVLSRLTIEGFRSLKLLTPEQARPFDVARQGINLSEASAFLCLERDAREPVARLVGSAFSSDAFHMTAPQPEGAGSVAAMRGALADAGLDPESIDWVHAHGTGSVHNDLSEGLAVLSVFGNDVPVTSTKAIHGHSLAASGALETVLCLESMRQSELLGTARLENPDPKIPIRHAVHGASARLRYVLKSSVGFGGVNGALVLAGVDR